MKITNETSIGSNSVASKKAGAKGEIVSPRATSDANISSVPAGEDRVELSGAKGQLDVLRSQLEATPEVRADVVQSFKDKIDSGSYWDDHSPEDIANSMIQHFEKYKNIGS